ncbi:MAG: RNA methyltransferase [Lewinellaceae bacterium]|nr:RNA methyltransferase [Lewinellaceae bacterium]
MEQKLIKEVRALHLAKRRKEAGMFIAEGIKTCQTMLSTGKFKPVYIFSAHTLSHLELGLKTDATIKVSAKEMSQISQLKQPSDILVVFSIPNTPITTMKSDDKIIYLDNVQDPGNVGTIIRLADWFGIEAVVRSFDSADFYNPKVVQAAMGSLAKVNLYEAELSEIVGEKIVYGTYMEGTSIFETQFIDNAILVLGSEGHGISEKNAKYIQEKITIYGASNKIAESLNVSVAAGIICAQWLRTS